MAKVKICGIRTAEAMLAAVAAQTEYVGLVFFPPSPRNISVADAVPLADAARGRAAIVALTVDADDALVEDIMRRVRPDMLQLHGSETPARAAALRRRFHTKVMKAIKVETRADAEVALAYAEVADLILFDAKPPKGADRPGGHGAVFDWRLLDTVAGKVPFMLSGGLTPENVAEAIRATGAETVDVSSGVETAPGVKSVALIQAFIAAAHGA